VLLVNGVVFKYIAEHNGRICPSWKYIPSKTHAQEDRPVQAHLRNRQGHVRQPRRTPSSLSTVAMASTKTEAKERRVKGRGASDGREGSILANGKRDSQKPTILLGPGAGKLCI
jgi:hypothetical protein